MAMSAKERAEKALEKTAADVAKAAAKVEKLEELVKAATAKLVDAKAVHGAVTAVRDHLAAHPALKQDAPVAVKEDEPEPEPVQGPPPVYDPFA